MSSSIKLNEYVVQLVNWRVVGWDINNEKVSVFIKIEKFFLKFQPNIFLAIIAFWAVGDAFPKILSYSNGNSTAVFRGT